MSYDTDIPPPLENKHLVGHADAEQTMLDAFASGKLPNAWLVSGPKGVGKATLAYRFARFLLTHSIPSEQSDGLFGESLQAEVPNSLEVDHDSPEIARILAKSHGDLLVVDTDNIDDDKVKQQIGVEKIRKINEFLSLTPSEAERRVVIVDSADAMNRSAANAILKVLEEPPLNSIILLISHNPGQLLPTIRSRCRFLKLKALKDSDVEALIKTLMPDLSVTERAFVIAMSEGSIGLATELHLRGGAEFYKKIVNIFSALPAQNITDIDDLGEKVEGKKNQDNWSVVSYMMQYFIAEIVRSGVNDNLARQEIVEGEAFLKQGLAKQCSLADWSELWQKICKMTAEADSANLGKKHTLINMFAEIRKATGT